jgi:hypothetical protein
MKKVTLMLALAATLFAACGKDDDQTTANIQEQPAQQVPAIVSMMYYLTASDDMLQYLDYTVTFDNGIDEVQDTVTTNRWEKIRAAGLPSTFTIKTRLHVKEGMYDALVAVDTFYVNRGHGYVYQIFDSTATAIPGMKGNGFIPSTSVGRGALIAEHVQAGDYDKTYTVSFDANGNKI